MEKTRDNKPISINKKINKKQDAEKIVKDYLKPSCEEELSQEQYPQINKE